MYVLIVLTVFLHSCMKHTLWREVLCITFDLVMSTNSTNRFCLINLLTLIIWWDKRICFHSSLFVEFDESSFTCKRRSTLMNVYSWLEINTRENLTTYDLVFSISSSICHRNKQWSFCYFVLSVLSKSMPDGSYYRMILSTRFYAQTIILFE